MNTVCRIVGSTFFSVVFMMGLPSLTWGADADIRLNSLGFLPNRIKQATIAAPCQRFYLKRHPDGKIVFRGNTVGPLTQADVNDTVWIADFSAYRREGAYVLEVPGVGRSIPFRIGRDVYDFAYRTAMRAFTLWRCGMAIEGTHEGITFRQNACHLDDAYLDFVGPDSSRRDATGGWHDAGDYNKYVVNAGITVGTLLLAWEQEKARLLVQPLGLPETASGLPEFLKEIKWETDWLLKMVLDSGKVSHKISAQSFCGFIMPDEEKEKRYFTDWSSTATADFVAVMAMASRSFRPYDPVYADRCLAAAEESYAFLRRHPENKRPNLRGFRTGGYLSSDPDDRLWAEAELWEATGNPEYREAFEARAWTFEKKILRDWDWPDVRNLGMLTYLFSRQPGKDPKLETTLREELLATADSIVAIARADVYGRPLGPKYYWGCNGSVARQAVVLQSAYRIDPKPAYLDAVIMALDHLFGRNVYGRSFVTGLGHRPPLFPHDRRSAADGIDPPWPGYLVGGGHRATDWKDEETDFRTNEIAINWQAALVYALAGMISER